MQITFIMTIINLIILIAFISAVVYLFMDYQGIKKVY